VILVPLHFLIYAKLTSYDKHLDSGSDTNADLFRGDKRFKVFHGISVALF
jgi:hypothetical protein